MEQACHTDVTGSYANAARPYNSCFSCRFCIVLVDFVPEDRRTIVPVAFSNAEWRLENGLEQSSQLPDPFPYQTNVRAADMRIFPTVKGEFRGQVTQIVMNELWMQRFHETLARVHKGTIRPGRKIFSFLSQVQPEVYHCGRLLLQGELIAETTKYST
jgi:hypothetical protein